MDTAKSQWRVEDLQNALEYTKRSLGQDWTLTAYPEGPSRQWVLSSKNLSMVVVQSDNPEGSVIEFVKIYAYLRSLSFLQDPALQFIAMYPGLDGPVDHLHFCNWFYTEGVKRLEMYAVIFQHKEQAQRSPDSLLDDLL